jgi:hypothetical protein
VTNPAENLVGLAGQKSSRTGAPQIKTIYKGLRGFRGQLGLAAGLGISEYSVFLCNHLPRYDEQDLFVSDS